MSRRLLIQTVVISLLSSCAGGRNIQYYGDYLVKSGETRITLKKDETFVYYGRHHIDATTALGNYKLNSDTVTLSYTDRNYDSIITPISDPRRTTLAQALGLPSKLLWRGKMLYIVINDGKKLKYAKLAHWNTF